MKTPTMCSCRSTPDTFGRVTAEWRRQRWVCPMVASECIRTSDPRPSGSPRHQAHPGDSLVRGPQLAPAAHDVLRHVRHDLRDLHDLMAQRLERSGRGKRSGAAATALRIPPLVARDLIPRQGRAHVGFVAGLAAGLPAARRPRRALRALAGSIRRWRPIRVRRVPPQQLLQLLDPRLELRDTSVLLLQALQERLATRAVGIRRGFVHPPTHIGRHRRAVHRRASDFSQLPDVRPKIKNDCPAAHSQTTRERLRHVCRSGCISRLLSPTSGTQSVRYSG